MGGLWSTHRRLVVSWWLLWWCYGGCHDAGYGGVMMVAMVVSWWLL